MPREVVLEALGTDAAAKLGILNSSSQLIGADDLAAPAPLNHFYRYLRESGRVVPIDAS
jgi:hypothetical protein